MYIKLSSDLSNCFQGQGVLIPTKSRRNLSKTPKRLRTTHNLRIFVWSLVQMQLFAPCARLSLPASCTSEVLSSQSCLRWKLARCCPCPPVQYYRRHARYLHAWFTLQSALIVIPRCHDGEDMKLFLNLEVV